jgi:SWI/SNF-related matrix-associated actin-dependent regulator 1 of chromatin subfamily A
MKMLLDIEEIPKVVLFCHHRSVMDALNEQLKDYGVVMVRGGIGPKRQQNAIDQFVENPAIRVFMGQLDAAGFGIDGLQGVCSRAVIAEPAWTPGTNEQAIDRLHRIGQHENVIATFLVVEGSLDEYVLASVLDKAQIIHSSLDRSLVGDITADLAAFDLRQLERSLEQIQ